MKDTNYGRNQWVNNPMFGKKHTQQTKEKMSQKQKLRLENVNKLLYKLREDQLDKRIREICHQLLIEYKNNQQ